MITLLYAVIGSVFAAVGDVASSALVSRKRAKHIKPAQQLFAGALIHTLLLGLGLLLLQDQFWFKPVFLTALCLVGIGIIDTLYNIFYLKALELAPVSETAPVESSTPIFTLLLSSLLPGTTNSPYIILIVILIALGIYIISLHHSITFTRKDIINPFANAGLRYALFTAALAGLSAVIIDFVFSEALTSELSLLFIRMLIITALTYAVYRPHFFPKAYEKFQWLKIIFTLEIIFVLERVFKTFAISEGNVSIAVAVTSVTPAIIIVSDAIFFKEKITKNKIIGSTLIVAALVIAVLKVQ